MNQIITTDTSQEEWLRILGKGMITIPKSWREELGFIPGKVVKAQKLGKSVVISSEEEAPYRVYSDEEINEFLSSDKLPQNISKKISRKLTSLQK